MERRASKAAWAWSYTKREPPESKVVGPEDMCAEEWRRGEGEVVVVEVNWRCVWVAVLYGTDGGGSGGGRRGDDDVENCSGS